MRGFQPKSRRENVAAPTTPAGGTSLATPHTHQLAAMEDRANQRPQVRETAQLQEKLNRPSLEPPVQLARKNGGRGRAGKFERQQHKQKRKEQEQAARHQERIIRDPRPPKSSGRGSSGPALNPWLTALLLTMMFTAVVAEGAQRVNNETPQSGSGGGGGRGSSNRGALVPVTSSNATMTTDLSMTPWTPSVLPGSFPGFNISSLLPFTPPPRVDNSRALVPVTESDRSQSGEREARETPSRRGGRRGPTPLPDRAELTRTLAEKTGLLEEQVKDVVDRYLPEGEGLEVGARSLDKLANHVKRLFGMRFEGEAEAPTFSGSGTAVTDAIERRLEAPAWEKLDAEEMLEKYEGQEPRLLQTISDIEAQLNRRGFLRRTIQQPMRWIDDLMQGRPFETAPVVDSEGRIDWSRQSGSSPQEQAAPSRQQPVRDNQVEALFARLQSEIPAADARDGCFARADFSAYYLQSLRGLKGVGKIRVEVKNARPDLRPQGELFRDAAVGREWLMHTAATITTEEGSTYVMDVALQRPLSRDEWIRALSVEPDDLTISSTDRWNFNLQDNQENGVSLIDVMSQMRGLYLNEVLGHGPGEEFASWVGWEYTMPAFAPIQTQTGAETYALEVQDPRGLFSGRELRQPLAPSEAGDYYHLEFPEQKLTLLVPKAFRGKIKNTGISGLKVSKDEINRKLDEVRNHERS